MTASDAPPQEKSPRLNPRRIALRVVLYVIALLPVLAGVCLWVVTRSWFIILLVAPELEQKLGGQVGIGDAAYNGDGVLVFEDVTLQTRALEGQASQVMHIGRAVIAVDPDSLLSGGLTIEDVELDGLLVRLSEDQRSPGTFNFSTLTPDWSTADMSGPMLPPSVKISNAVIELGEHVGRDYHVVGRRRMSGEMYPALEGGGWYDFKLEELDRNAVGLGQDGLLIEGRWNVETMEHRARIDGLTLDDRTFGMCPQIARLWWQRIMPEGPVGSAFIEWKKGQPYVAVLNVDRMALNIPIDAQEFTASYQQGRVETTASLPRMYVHSGSIRLEGNQLRLDNLVGVFGSSDRREELVEMPYHVNFSIHDMPPFDWKDPQSWMDDVVATAPFEMSVRMNNFRLTQGAKAGEGVVAGEGMPSEDAPVVDLPRQVADTLARFQLTGWSLNTEVEITRAAPTIDEAGHRVAAPFKTKGKAQISDASGAFQGFPYPLDDVTAYVEFDSERIDLIYLNAKGSNDAPLRMSGWIAPPGHDAAARLTLTARNVPLDERFRAGLKGGQLKTYDIMLHRPSCDRLLHEGLLPDDADLAAAAEARRKLVAELAALPADGDDALVATRRADLQREVKRLATIEEAGAFALGGTIDLDLIIEREQGVGRKPVITGTIDVHRAGAVYMRFPYPIYVLGGRLSVEKDRVRIVPSEHSRGIPIATPGGGRGTVVGEVELVQTEAGTQVKPALSVDLENDYLSELLYAAMPLTGKTNEERAEEPIGDGERSLVARILAGAGIAGWLNFTGVINADETGQPTFDFAVELYDAKAEPNEELFVALQELGLPSPRGITLDSVRALLQVTPTTIRLVDFNGQRGDAEISATASVDLAAEPLLADMTVEFDDLALERYMVDLAPASGAAKTAELWDRYQPQGMYDARITYHTGGDRPDSADLQVWPEELGITIDGEPVWLVCDQGDVVLHDKQVTFRDLVLNVTTDNRDDGVIALSGSYGLAEDERAMRVEGTWTDGELASPIITETMRLIGAREHAERYRSFKPNGSFDAKMFFDSPGPGQPSQYQFTVKPRSVGVTMNDTPIFAELEPDAEVIFTPGRLIFSELSGTHSGGRFRIDGAADVADLIDIDVDVEYEGRADSPQLLAILPAPLRTTLQTLKIQAEQPVKLTEGRLQVTQVQTDKPADGEWDTAFSGLLETSGASLKVAGLQFSKLDGRFGVEAAHDPVLGTSLAVNARADRAQANGRQLTNLEADINLVDGGRAISVPAIRADSYGGVVTGDVWVGLEEGSEYEIALDLGSVGMSGLTGTAGKAHSGDPPPGGVSQPGRVFGSFRLSGRRGDEDSQRGRGMIRIVEGRMVDMPIVLRLLQLMELMPPVSGSLDFADVDFYVDGGRLVFERLFLECPTLWVFGEGEMSFPGMELDIRLRTKGTVPVVGDIVAGVSDQLFLVEVTGPVGDPKARLVALPGVNGSGKKSSSRKAADAHASAD
jgi:hypothetical protein